MDDAATRIELDSHANMPVVGRQVFILNETGRTASVSAYNPDYPCKHIPIVDAALLYQDRFTGQDHILVIRNALYVESMTNCLIPPFILREHGITVNDTPKIHSRDPCKEDHAIIFDEQLLIPLSLSGSFSYFEARKPTVEEMKSTQSVYVMTPAMFDAHDSSYAQREDYNINWEGEMRPAKDRATLALADVPSPSATICDATALSDLEESNIDANLLPRRSHEDDGLKTVNPELAGLSTDLCDRLLFEKLSARAELGAMMCSIGTCHPEDGATLLDAPTTPRTCQPGPPSDVNIASLSMEEFVDYLTEHELNGQLDFDEMMSAATYAKPSRGVAAAHLSKIWKIDLPTAERTIDATTQLRNHSEEPSMARDFGTNDRMLRYRRLKQYFFMDTFFATKKGGKSSRGNTCCQLFVTDKGYIYMVPMRSKADVLLAIKQFAKEIGAPDAIVCDASKEQTKTDLKRFLNSIGTTLRVLEEGTPWANRAELYVGLMKEAVRRDMRDSNCPFVFWDYCIERRTRVNNLTAKDTFQLHGQVPHTDVTGEQGDISNLCRFGWYEWCYTRNNRMAFPHNKETLARNLGPAKGVGNEMCQWVLLSNGAIVARRTVRPLKTEEIHSPYEEQKRKLFDAMMDRKFGGSVKKLVDEENESDPMTEPASEEEDSWEPYEDNDEFAKPTPDMEDSVDINGRLLNQQPVYDLMLNLEVQVEEASKRGKVIKRIVAPDGSQMGTYDDIPALNTIMYEVEFDDGMVKEYGATAIAENILTQVDDDGFSTPALKAIVDWKKDPAVAVAKRDQYVQSHSGRRLKKTTKGWMLKVLWSDGTHTWIDLKFMKESNPVDVAEFAAAKKIDDEPAFKWWVPYTLRKRDAIISAVTSRARKTTHKYGVELPRSVAHAKELDARNGNNMWMEALQKEMVQFGVAIEIQGQGIRAPPGWSKVTGHLVWDVKMDFTRKARWVLDGHKTPDPICSQYAGVVSRESVRIAFTYAALNGLDVCVADIRNAYLQAPSSRKDYFVCGPEFGLENEGKVALIHRAVYGGKSAGRDFRNHLRSCMIHLGFESCPADPDVWMRPAVKADGQEYWEYILLYTDDCLCISEHPERTLRNQVGKYFQLKEESIGPPKIYLGGNVRKVTLENGVSAWAFGSSQYVQQAVKNVEKYLADCHANGDKRFSLPAKANTPMRTIYRPELDTSPELQDSDAVYYMSLIGVLRWIVELGRVDVCLECSVMSSHLALPRIGHLEQVLHMFAYLKKHHNAEMVFDPSYPEIDTAAFQRKDWSTSEFGHVEGKEVLPKKRPRERGSGFIMRAKVDADHATDTVTRRSRSGFIVYINSAPVYWFSKKQTAVESSSFGSEFCAMKLCCEYLRGLRYKLRMMGIPIHGPVYLFGDNQSVLANTSIPESQLKKKSQSIAYHFIREGSARDEWRIAYVNTHENESDLLTKPLPDGEKRHKFVRRVLHHIFGSC